MEGIQKTNDYGKFKTIFGNRKLIRDHITNLTVSILEDNMLASNPIIVNRDMEVIDGQHRLEVAKNNNLDIYYLVLEDGTIENVIKLNSRTKSWRLIDYIMSYADRGNKDYIWLYKFLREYSLNVTTAIILLYGADTEVKSGRIKSGKLKLSEEQRRKALDRADLLFDVRDFVNIEGSVISRGLCLLIIELEETGEAKKFINTLRKNGKSYKVYGDLKMVKEILKEAL